jgi:curved DNA-binding protein CbpA
MAPVEIEDDYYEVLEISDNATLDVVTKSYRRLAKI